MTRFYLTNTAVALGATVGDTETVASSTHTPTNAGSVITGTVGASISNRNVWTAATTAESGDLHTATDWPTTGWGLSYDVASVGANITYNLALNRINTTTTTSSGGLVVFSAQTGTGIKTSTGLSWATVNGGGTRAATDWLDGVVTASNSSSMSSQTVTIRYSDSDTWIEGADLGTSGTTVVSRNIHATNHAITRSYTW